MMQRSPSTTGLLLTAVLCLSATAGGSGCAEADDKRPAVASPYSDSAVATRNESEAPGGLDSATQISPTRWSSRLTIDRLEAAIRQVAGNDASGNPIEWRVNGVPALNDSVFGKVLGRPDYVNSSSEDKAPSSLYLKFMRDMARDVCSQMVAADLQRAPGVVRTLWRFVRIEEGPAEDIKVTQNLQYLLLRFLGMRLAADHPLIANYRTVYEAGLKSSGQAKETLAAQSEGWRGVCIGLLESPLFHID
jgi:hypothetical protein